VLRRLSAGAIIAKNFRFNRIDITEKINLMISFVFDSKRIGSDF